MSRGALAILALLLAMVGAERSAHGQAAWEYAPYRVRVRLALEAVPQLPPTIEAEIAEMIERRAAAVLGAVWQVETLAAPASLRRQLLRGGSPTLDGIAAAVPEDLNGDKLYLVSLARTTSGFDVAVRELDCRARQLGEPCQRTAYSVSAVGPLLWDALLESFTPVARIETVAESQIGCRLRAGGLIVDPASRALVESGMVLRPVVRRNDRSGQPVKGGIQALPWTLLAVTARHDTLLDCTLSSGFRAPIPARGSARTERLALLVRPRWDVTRLVLRARTDAGKPLAGYEIQVRDLASDAPAEPLGVTDADGAIELARGGGLQLLYVKSGQQLLARLPVLPGQSPTLVASLPDDDRRLQAEGLIAAMKSRALDLVARREILAARFRAKLKAGELDEAQRLLDDFRRLETRVDLGRDLDQYRQRLSSPDRLTQDRIDKLFTDAQKLLALRPLSDALLAELTRELTAARASGGGAKASGN